MIPSCKGEQSLTFKRRQRSTVARWEPKWELNNRPKPRADNSSITPMSEINPKGLNLNTNDTIFHFDYFTWKKLYTENLNLLLSFYQKTLACYRNNQLPVREGDNSIDQ